MLVAQVNQFWYALPLIVSISLVYAATRHEHMRPILGHAVRVGGWIIGFLVIVFVLLFWMNRQV